MTGTFFALASPTIDAVAVERVEDEHLHALGEHRLRLLLLLAGVAVGVRVEDLAAGAELLDLRLEEGLVRRLVARGDRVREEEADLGVGSILRASTRTVSGAVRTRCEGDGCEQDRGRRDDRSLGGDLH